MLGYCWNPGRVEEYHQGSTGGHFDRCSRRFQHPETPLGFIGGMCLALACGRGPKLNDMIRNGDRLLSEENVVHLASRSLDPAESENMSSSPMKIFSAFTLREEGISSTLNLAVSSLADRCDWIVCHLDVDSIDPKTIPAVNFHEQDGLSLEETKQILDAAEKTEKLKLFELAGYNPDLDQDRTCATKLVNLFLTYLAHQHQCRSDEVQRYVVPWKCLKILLG